MDMYLWDEYKPEEITPQLRYWADYWKEIIQRFPDPVFGLQLDSPRLLFSDVLDEVEFNNLKNEKIKNYFSKKSKEWSSRGKIIGIETLGHVQILSSALRSEPHSYISAVCKQGINYLNGGSFFRHVHSLLVTLLLKTHCDEKDYEAIERASELLILEFTANGYSLKACEKFPANIFDGYKMVDDFAVTKFPHLLDADGFKKDGEIDYKIYSRLVIEKMTSLTVEERLVALGAYWNMPEVDYKFIFPLWGVRGDKEVSVGAVTLYSPLKKQYVRNAFGNRNRELFGQDKSFVFSNAIIPVKTRDIEDALEKALVEIETALDFLGFFGGAGSAIRVQRHCHVLVRNDGQYAGEHMGNSNLDKDTFWAWHESLDLDASMGMGVEAQLQQACEKIIASNQESYSKRQIVTALHWFRKAKEERHNEDRLLNFWVVLEKMFVDPHHNGGLVQDKISSILELVPAIYTKRMLYNVGWNLFYYLRHLLNASHGERRFLELPVELLKAAKLERIEGQTVYIKDFIEKLDEIIRHVDKRIIRKKVEHVNSYFSDNKYAFNFLERMMEEVRVDLLLIYRYRNKVVHDAHYDDRMLPYYVQKAERYAGHFLRYMVSKVEQSDRGILDLAMTERANIASLLKSLESNPEFRLVDLI